MTVALLLLRCAVQPKAVVLTLLDGIGSHGEAMLRGGLIVFAFAIRRTRLRRRTGPSPNTGALLALALLYATRQQIKRPSTRFSSLAACSAGDPRT